MNNATCKDCGAELSERPQKSRRTGEILLICANGHKWQGRLNDGFLTLYRSNWRGQRGEGRKVATVTISPSDFEIMARYGVKQQAVFNLGIDTLRNMQ